MTSEKTAEGGEPSPTASSPAAVRDCRKKLLRAIAIERRKLKKLRERLTKEEQTAVEAAKASRFMPAPEEAALMLRYHTSIARIIQRLMNQLEHLQARGRGRVVPPTLRAQTG